MRKTDALLFFLVILFVILVFLEFLKFNVLVNFNNTQGSLDLQTGMDISAFPNQYQRPARRMYPQQYSRPAMGNHFSFAS